MVADDWIPNSEMEAFGRRVRDTRVAQGLSQWALARKIGVSSNTLLSWEKGHWRPNPYNISRLASALGVSEEFLRTGMNPSEAQRPEDERQDSIGSEIEHLKRKIASALGMEPTEIVLTLELRRRGPEPDTGRAE